MSTSPVSMFGDDPAFRSAMGALRLRKRCHRKRTPTGELVWSDLADVTLSLGLIIWNTSQSHRVGTTRCVFLREFLQSRGVYKSRKQISSRLQVLKGEWRNTSYEELLRNPQVGNFCQASEAASPSQDLGISTNSSGLSLEHAGLPPQQTPPRVSHAIPSSTIPNTQLPETLPQEDYHAPPPLLNTTAPHTAWRWSSSLPPVDLEKEPLDQRSFYMSAHITHDDTASGYYMPSVRCDCMESIGNIQAGRAYGLTPSFVDHHHSDSMDRTNEEDFT